MSKAMATAGNNANGGSEKVGMTDPQAPEYALRLCITGMTLRSQQALINIKYICDSYLRGRYHLEVIDLYQQPKLAAELQIIATPTLLRDQPLPLRRLIGSLSDIKQALRLLGVPASEDGISS
ncbi:MAG: circadian clock KaiB family protein [Nitrospiraceae bacterium]